jgi:hypothetical protein
MKKIAAQRFPETISGNPDMKPGGKGKQKMKRHKNKEK